MEQAIILQFIIIVFCYTPGCRADNPSQQYYEELKMLQKIHTGYGDREKAMSYYSEAMQFHMEKKYRDSERLWYMAAKTDPGWLDPFFQLACSTALQGKHDIALGYIEITQAKDSLKWFKRITADTDLAGIRQNEKYTRLIQQYDPRNHWVTNILNKQFIFTHNDAWNNETRETLFKPDGMLWPVETRQTLFHAIIHLPEERGQYRATGLLLSYLKKGVVPELMSQRKNRICTILQQRMNLCVCFRATRILTGMMMAGRTLTFEIKPAQY